MFTGSFSIILISWSIFLVFLAFLFAPTRGKLPSDIHENRIASIFFFNYSNFSFRVDFNLYFLSTRTPEIFTSLLASESPEPASENCIFTRQWLVGYR